jgi:hypothetical protein
MMGKRLSCGLLALALASWAGTQILAYHAHYHPGLGQPMLPSGRHSLYLPTDGWRWGWQHPHVFHSAAVTIHRRRGVPSDHQSFSTTTAWITGLRSR